ncbi:hypothetical protein DV515_00012256 [Chloebia gouldiae]|uniref:Uncharacterized protein n=1 Tax=Chloebia gouldiae TaxID=44316 RepID=A0A3L8S441_CHLGU|nr:hypothetical protein DV515_00012256 [Chloebia gouldiae]
MAALSLTEPSLASRQEEGPPLSLLFLLFPCSADLALREAGMLQGSQLQPAKAQAPCRGQAAAQAMGTAATRCLSPAVVAKQPTLMLEMCNPCPEQFTVLPMLQHLTREKEARRKALNPSTFPCTVGCSSDTSLSRLDGEMRPPGSTHG